MHNAHLRPAFHISPARGWVNDPNGLCHYKGDYHVFFQYSADWPLDDTRSWGHMISKDLLHWTDAGIAITPSLPEDRDGVYSGCSYITPENELWCYYTGNVIHAGGYDYIHEGREANEILVTSEDALHFSKKRVLLRNEDYPIDCTQHVRDPKVWREQGSLWMLLGARDNHDCGEALVYRSDDGLNWQHNHTIRSREGFGYMWECPNCIQIGGYDFLAVCPQGLESEELRWHNRWQAGYFPLETSLLDTRILNQKNFVEWDYGWDFYAPQSFIDDEGRTLLIGWMGSFDREWTSTPNDLAWCHCMTFPRELSIGPDELLRQLPVEELTRLRNEHFSLDAPVAFDSLLAELVIEGIKAAGSIVINDALEIEISQHFLNVRFFDDALGAGRTRRTVPLQGLPSDVRILIDGSTLELFLDGGKTVFSTRWFPKDSHLSLSSTISAHERSVYQLRTAIL